MQAISFSAYDLMIVICRLVHWRPHLPEKNSLRAHGLHQDLHSSLLLLQQVYRCFFTKQFFLSCELSAKHNNIMCLPVVIYTAQTDRLYLVRIHFLLSWVACQWANRSINGTPAWPSPTAFCHLFHVLSDYCKLIDAKLSDALLPASFHESSTRQKIK